MCIGLEVLADVMDKLTVIVSHVIRLTTTTATTACLSTHLIIRAGVLR